MKRIGIKGAIIPNSMQWIYDLMEVDATCPKKVEQAIAEAEQAGEDFVIEINSGGGSLFAGAEIYSMLKQRKCSVEIVGVAASAASLIAMGGEKVAISPVGQLMIHGVSVIAEGNQYDMQHTADELKSMDEGLALAYKTKCGLDTNDLLDLMAGETWLNAEKALDLNLVDEIMYQDENITDKLVAADEGALLSAKITDKLQEMKSQLAELSAENKKLKAKADFNEFMKGIMA